MFTFITKS